MVDLRLLHTLRVLHDQETVTATAEALHLSPSAVSHQLRQLSRQVGTELLRQDGRRLRLTPAGQVLLSHADILCTQWEWARADVAEQGSSTHRTLRIDGFATSVGSLLAPAAHDLLRTATPIRGLITEVDTRDSYQRLLAGQADIAVLTPLPDSPPVDDARFTQEPLLDDFLDLVVSTRHPLAEERRCDLAAAATEEWIAPHHDQNRLIQALCAAAGFAPRTVHHASEWAAVLAMVSEGLGVCLAPRLLSVAHHPHVARVPVSGSPQPFRRVLTCVRRGSEAQPTIAEGLETLRARAAHLNGTPGATDDPHPAEQVDVDIAERAGS